MVAAKAWVLPAALPGGLRTPILWTYRGVVVGYHVPFMAQGLGLWRTRWMARHAVAPALFVITNAVVEYSNAWFVTGGFASAGTNGPVQIGAHPWAYLPICP